MTLPSSDLCMRLLCYLAEPASRALALAALTGLALALGRVKDAAVRLAVWTAVLYASLAMPFLARVAPAVRLPMPALVSTHFVRPPATAPTSIAPAGLLARATDAKHVGAALVAARPAAQSLRPACRMTPGGRAASRGQPPGLSLHGGFSWPLAAVGLYLLIAGVLLGQVALGFYFSRRLRFFSEPLGDRRVLSTMLEQCAGWGLRTAPGLAVSPSVTVPVTLGAWHPVILLPTAWRAWSSEKIHAVLAHELSHVVRRDALRRALAAIHRSVFWFSPLAWWLERHLAALAEQASDDAALRTGADRVFYANVLLSFYQAIQNAAGGVRWEGVAMTRGKQARERVDRILDSSRRLSAGLRKPAWAALVLLAAPLICLLAGAHPVVARKPHADERRALVASVIRPAVESLYAELQAPAAGPATPASPVAPAAPKPAPAPKPPAQPEPTPSEWRYGDSGEDWAITAGESLTLNGSFHGYETERLRALRRESKGDFIWFRRDGKAYIIRDAATVQKAKAFWAPQEALGRQQEELGRQQEALGAKQEELGRQMEQVRVPVPELKAELLKIQARLDQLHKNGATQEELGELQEALGDLQGKLGELQGEAGGQQGAIGGKQGELGAQQEKLGEQQEKLGEEQARLAEEASRKMKALIDNALAKGLAKPE